MSQAGPHTRAPGSALPETTDVLIVGSGPAGLTLAASLSYYADIRTVLIEEKPGPMEKGQADGVSCRSMEMFQAFGFADRVKAEAYWVNETTFWKPDPDAPANIIRTGQIQDVEDGLSDMPHVILNQGRVHDMYLDVMARSPNRLHPDYGRRVVSVSRDDDAAYPVAVSLERTDTGATETIRARYVVGCDGARSVVRRSIGRDLIGDAANKAWGVMDVLAVTDFPDIRKKTLIQSNDQGTVLIIPREGGYLVRLYVEMEKLAKDERVRDRNISVDRLIAAAGRIFHPYLLDVRDVVWWSVYEIGQRVTDRFDDGDGATGNPRVFIAGDACHTHSPKAGQGMNVSMGDTFNLGWKLAAVLQGRATPALLASYSAERQGVAQALIDFDQEWSRVIAERDDTGGNTPKFQQYFIEHGRYTAGVSVKYPPSALTGDGRWQHLATGFEIGTRLHSAPVIRLADGKPLELGHTITADGRWRLFAFAGQGDPTAPDSGLVRLCRYLSGDPASPLRRHTPRGANPDAVFDLRAVVQQGFRDLQITAFPDLLFPQKGRLGLRDYEKVYSPDQKTGRDIFDLRGINRDRGCLMIVRPDQYVATILPLDGYADLAAFFAAILTDQPQA